jgi:hypothetical protein
VLAGGAAAWAFAARAQQFDRIRKIGVLTAYSEHDPEPKSWVPYCWSWQLEGGLLLVAANTGFLGGPAVLANMAADSWVPHQYRYLSTRLVTQRGILLMGLAAFGILLVTGGSVALLVVLYSINVFLTFSLSLLRLCIYWWRVRESDRRWPYRLASCS